MYTLNLKLSTLPINVTTDFSTKGMTGPTCIPLDRMALCKDSSVSWSSHPQMETTLLSVTKKQTQSVPSDSYPRRFNQTKSQEQLQLSDKNWSIFHPCKVSTFHNTLCSIDVLLVGHLQGDMNWQMASGKHVTLSDMHPLKYQVTGCNSGLPYLPQVDRAFQQLDSSPCVLLCQVKTFCAKIKVILRALQWDIKRFQWHKALETRQIVLPFTSLPIADLLVALLPSHRQWQSLHIWMPVASRWLCTWTSLKNGPKTHHCWQTGPLTPGSALHQMPEMKIEGKI